MDSKVNFIFDPGVQQDCPFSSIAHLKFGTLIQFDAYEAGLPKIEHGKHYRIEKNTGKATNPNIA